MSTKPNEETAETPETPEAPEAEEPQAAEETPETTEAETPAETETAAETVEPGSGWGRISPEDVAAAAEGAGADIAADAAAAAEATARVPELEAEVGALKDKLLRAMAETENVRRRTQREKEDASKYAIANFAREVLDVADNLRRALDSIEEGARADNAALDSLATGVEMTEREMLGAMERVGIRPIEALGKRFDHNYHEAMFEIPDPNQPNGTVLQEVQTGYTLGERLLRPSRVGVSKGGPKEAPSDSGAAPAEDAAAADPAARDPYDQKPGESGSKLDEEL